MRRTRKRGGNRPLPLQYFGAAAPVSASAGVDRLDVTGHMVRPTIGGQRSIRSMRSTRSMYKKRGGFYPTVMGNFVPAASKYITPLALFAAYKLMKKSQHTKKKRRTRSKRSKQSKRN
jgi:hypothetical protein